MRRRTDRLFGGAVLVALVYGGFVTRDSVQAFHNRHERETFPFFRWSLFSTVPDPYYTIYTLRFTELDGAPVEPMYLDESMVPDRDSAGMQALIARIAVAAMEWRFDDAEHLRAVLESRYLDQVGSARYEVVRQVVSLDEWRTCECFTTEEVVAVFTLDRP